MTQMDKKYLANDLLLNRAGGPPRPCPRALPRPWLYCGEMEGLISGAVMVVRWQVGRPNPGLITAKCCGEGRTGGSAETL